jgi:Rieske Fe-S protein
LAAVAGATGFALTRTTDAAKDPTRVSSTTDAYGMPMAANAYGTAVSTGVELAAVAKVPSGGGLVLDARKVVLTKDLSGTVRAFTAVCPHQGCTVSGVDKGVIECPCHGSRFDAGTGAVLRGPANQGLTAVEIAIRGGSVFTK